MVLIGLGNPGDKFKGTRHNLGIDALRAWVREMEGEDWKEEPSFFSEVASAHVNDMRVDCMFPLTFMNDVGKAVAAYLAFYNLDSSNVLVIHDDLELPLGEVAVKETGSAHGHNGVRSIHQALGTDELRRVRIGIGRPLDDTPVDAFVLQRFTPEERALVEEALTKASPVISQQVQQLTE